MSLLNKIISKRKQKKADRDTRNLLHLFETHAIKKVIDVGANQGQYAEELRSGGYLQKIVSFEPILNNNKILKEKSSADKKWIIAPPMALSNQDGEIEINVANNSDMSSLMPMRDVTLEALPGSFYVGKETVLKKKLDSVFSDYVETEESVFLKVDTQGHEEAVLEGASQSLNKIKGLQLELSIVPLYDGEKTFLDVIPKVQKFGFEPYYVIPGFYSKRISRQLQIDIIFFRP